MTGSSALKPIDFSFFYQYGIYNSKKSEKSIGHVAPASEIQGSPINLSSILDFS
jgi:hypothetical protein